MSIIFYCFSINRFAKKGRRRAALQRRRQDGAVCEASLISLAYQGDPFTLIAPSTSPIGAAMSRSALLSYGVGLLLMSTSFFPP